MYAKIISKFHISVFGTERLVSLAYINNTIFIDNPQCMAYF